MPTLVFRLPVAVFLAAGLLVGCSATNPHILRSYDATKDARVRVFVYSADRIRLDFDLECYTNPGILGHGEGLETNQRGHYQGSRSVGMPPTLKRSEAVFDEFIISAGVPVTVSWKFGGEYKSSWTGVSSRSPETKVAGHFVPVAGKDYEIYGRDRKGVVEDLIATGGGDMEKLVELKPAEACSAKPN